MPLCCFAMVGGKTRGGGLGGASEGLAVNTNCFITPRELSPHKVTVKLWEHFSEKQNNLFVRL